MTPDKYERAYAIWPILVENAIRREKMTYGTLAETIGMPGAAQAMRVYLNPIMWYCVINELPPLTATIVNQDTGQPGEGLINVGPENIEEVWKSVFAHNWQGTYRPTPQELRQAENRYR